MSISRPDPSSPTSIAEASFGTSRRGFDQNEVRDFLRMVAAEFGRLRERERFLERELRLAQDDRERGAGAPLDEDAMTELLGEEAMRLLITARESAGEIREKAERAAAQVLNEAADEAKRVREAADIEATRRQADAAADAESELAMAKQQGREMVNEARAYRERVLSDLARRRELAREQIEQLVHGRDRLMQAFERARLVAAEVVAEIEPLGEPNEYVNLAPTTGPLPVMIANSPRPGNEAPARPAGADDHPAGSNLSVISNVEIDADGDDADGDGAAGDGAGSDGAGSDGAGSDGAAGDGAGSDGAAGDDADGDGEAELRADQSTVDAIADGGDDGDAGDDDGDDGQAVAAAGGDAAIVDIDTATSGVADDDVDHDDVDHDVVVDLFARLRAGSDNETESDEVDEIEAGAEAGVDQDVDDEAHVDTDTDTDADAQLTVDVTDDAVVDDADADAGTDGDAEATPFEQRDEAITPLIVAGARKLKRTLADEQNEVLDALRRCSGSIDTEALIPGDDVHGQRYVEAISDELLAAAYAGSETTHATKRKIRKAHAEAAATAAGQVLIDGLVLPLRARLDQCVRDGAGDDAATVKKVRALYRELKTKRIDETLDDVMRTAHGRGVLAGFAAEQLVVWEIDSRFPACPDCDDNALAGAVTAGSPFPTGDTCAPAHQGCRCLLAPADR